MCTSHQRSICQPAVSLIRRHAGCHRASPLAHNKAVLCGSQHVLAYMTFNLSYELVKSIQPSVEHTLQQPLQEISVAHFSTQGCRFNMWVGMTRSKHHITHIRHSTRNTPYWACDQVGHMDIVGCCARLLQEPVQAVVVQQAHAFKATITSSSMVLLHLSEGAKPAPQQLHNST